MKYKDNKEMIASDLLILVITGLVSIYPVSRLIKYRDKKKGRD